MHDVTAAKAEFLEQLRASEKNPKIVENYERILDDFIDWSERHHPGIAFKWHDEVRGKKHHALVKYCRAGSDSSFWAIWPDKVPKLTLLADRGKGFPEELRAEARKAFSAIEVQDDVPTVHLNSLFMPAKREQVKELMERLLIKLAEGV